MFIFSIFITISFLIKASFNSPNYTHSTSDVRLKIDKPIVDIIHAAGFRVQNAFRKFFNTFLTIVNASDDKCSQFNRLVNFQAIGMKRSIRNAQRIFFREGVAHIDAFMNYWFNWNDYRFFFNHINIWFIYLLISYVYVNSRCWMCLTKQSYQLGLILKRCGLKLHTHTHVRACTCVCVCVRAYF